MTNAEAFAILEDALRRCERENMQIDSVYTALKLLSPQARQVRGATGVYWPFHQFWRSLKPTDGEMAFGRTGRQQTANAALRGMRLRVEIFPRKQPS